MKIFFKKQLLITITSCFTSLLNTANADDIGGVEQALPRATDCILVGTIRDYRVLDNRNLVVTGSRKKLYHIALHRTAQGLQSALQIGFSSRTSRLCPGFDKVVVNQGVRPEAVPIASIRQLDETEYEHLLIRFELQQPEHSNTPTPADVAGAEVEELD